MTRFSARRRSILDPLSMEFLHLKFDTDPLRVFSSFRTCKKRRKQR